VCVCIGMVGKLTQQNHTGESIRCKTLCVSPHTEAMAESSCFVSLRDCEDCGELPGLGGNPERIYVLGNKKRSATAYRCQLLSPLEHVIRNCFSLTTCCEILSHHDLVRHHQSTKGSWETVTAGGMSLESGMSSKFEVSCSSFIVGL